MTSTSQQLAKGRERVLPTLDAFIQVLNIAKESCGIPPAEVAFGSACTLLATIRDTIAKDKNYVDLGRACGDVCQTLYRRLKGRRLDGLNQSILDAIGELTATLAGIQRKIVKQGKRNVVVRFILAKSDKDKITAWKQDLIRVLHVFNTELAIDAHTAVADTHAVVTDAHTVAVDVHRNMPREEGASDQNHSILNAVESAVLRPHSMPLGESPPPAPRDCFGRDELVEKVIRFAENLEPFALTGAGGIGKTSVALTVLHHDRIKERFGENRRFVRCDQFPASHAHFLARLSEVLGAGVENPEDLTPLRPLLSSKEIFIILDNAESILDPKKTGATEIYSLVDELSRFKTICLCITSRITIIPPLCKRPEIPPLCKRPEIPPLSMEAARDIFYGIYADGGRSNIIDDLLMRLDFHALSITLLASAASHNSWDHDQLAKEWDAQRAQVPRTDYNESLAATIELSLASPIFRSLGPDARDLLGVVAFFPQGIDEKNLDWLFPAISDRKNIFGKFRGLSLTHRSNGFITMLAPIRDYLSPQDPQSSPLLCATRDRYFGRLSIVVHPEKPRFEEARWIVLEDVNVECLLDVFASLNQTRDDIWVVCGHFMEHLHWHKPRQTILRSKIESLPDDHPSKPNCLFLLSLLLQRMGNETERKQLLTGALELYRQRGNDTWIAYTLRSLSDANRLLERFEEGIQQAEEALEIFERINDTNEQAISLESLAQALFDNNQVDAAEKATYRAIELISGKGQEYTVCGLHRVLGKVHESKGEREKAIHHFKTAIGIASPFNWHDELFWNHFNLADLFRLEYEFGNASDHIERAKSHAVNNTYRLGRAIRMQAHILYGQGRFQDATSEALRSLQIFEMLGAAGDVVHCRNLLQAVEQSSKIWGSDSR